MATLATSIAIPEQPETRPGSIPDRSPAARAGWWVVAGAVVVLAALATWNSAHKSLWMDEAYSEYTTRLPLVAATLRAVNYELQAPLYFSVLDLWRHMDQSVMFGRALSTLAAMAFVVVMAGIGRRAGLRQWWWLGIAAAFTPGVVWAASELRCYALVMLIAAGSLYFYLGLLLPRTHVARRDGVGYVVTAILGLYTFYYACFMLAGQWIAAWIRRRGGLLTGLLAIAGAALVPMTLVIIGQIPQHHHTDIVSFDLMAHPRYAVYKVVGTMMGAFEGQADTITLPHAASIFMVVAVGVPLLRTFVSSERWDSAEGALAVAAIVPFVVLGFLRLFNMTPVHPRHFLLTLPGLLLIYGIWIQRMAAGWPRAVTGSILAAAMVIGLVDYQQHNVQREDWRGAARYVAAHGQPGDLVLMYDPDRMLPFNDYFAAISRDIPVRGVPTDMNRERYDPDTYAIQDTAVVAVRLKELGADTRRLWFVSATRLIAPLSNGPSEVIEYLNAHDRLDAPISLAGVRIVHAQPR